MTKNFAAFPSPVGEGEIVRCYYCRENKNPYKYGEFQGP